LYYPKRLVDLVRLVVCVGVGSVVSRDPWKLAGELARPLSCSKHGEGMGGVNGSSQFQFLALRAAKRMEGIDDVRSSPAPLRVMLCKHCEPMGGLQFEMHKTPVTCNKDQSEIILAASLRILLLTIR
jgi:hypothetical protein